VLDALLGLLGLELLALPLEAHHVGHLALLAEVGLLDLALGDLEAVDLLLEGLDALGGVPLHGQGGPLGLQLADLVLEGDDGGVKLLGLLVEESHGGIDLLMAVWRYPPHHPRSEGVASSASPYFPFFPPSFRSKNSLSCLGRSAKGFSDVLRGR
jgi:hypothetical protein